MPTASDGPYASRKYKFVPKVDYAAMHDFVVYVEGSLGTNRTASTNLEEVTTTRIAQEGAVFSPHVLPVMVGTTVEWPNNDRIYHNVFSMSDAKQFDLGLYKGNPSGQARDVRQAGARGCVLFDPHFHELHRAGAGKSVFCRHGRKWKLLKSRMFRRANIN